MPKIYTKEELTTLVNSTDPTHRKEITQVLRDYDKPMSEIIAMKPDARIAYILEKQGGAKAAGKAAPAAAGKAAAKATPAGAAPKAAKKAAAAPEPEEEEEQPAEEEAAEGSGGGGGSVDVGALAEAVAGLLAPQFEALNEKLDALAARVDEVETLVMDTHFVARAHAALSAGLDEAGYEELKEPLLGKLVGVSAEGEG